MALDTTVGGSSSDSYATLAYARAKVIELSLVPVFGPIMQNLQAIQDDQFEALLKEATRRLDALNYDGYRYDANQALEFPRTGGMLPARHRAIIPTALKDAQVVLAAYLADSTVAITTDDEAERDRRAGVQSKTIGKRSVTYGTGIQSIEFVPSIVEEILKRDRLLTNVVHVPRG